MVAVASGAVGLVPLTASAAYAGGVGGHWARNGYPIFLTAEPHEVIGYTNTNHGICIYSVSPGGWVRTRDLNNGLIGYQTVGMVVYSNPAWFCT
jgi:hypothetical protein